MMTINRRPFVVLNNGPLSGLSGDFCVAAGSVRVSAIVDKETPLLNPSSVYACHIMDDSDGPILKIAHMGTGAYQAIEIVKGQTVTLTGPAAIIGGTGIVMEWPDDKTHFRLIGPLDANVEQRLHWQSSVCPWGLVAGKKTGIHSLRTPPHLDNFFGAAIGLVVGGSGIATSRTGIHHLQLGSIFIAPDSTEGSLLSLEADAVLGLSLMVFKCGHQGQ